MNGLDGRDECIFGGVHGGPHLGLDGRDACCSVLDVRVARSARNRSVEQRAANIVGGVLGCTVAGIGHVAIGARHACSEVRAAGGEHLEFWVLDLDHRRI